MSEILLERRSSWDPESPLQETWVQLGLKFIYENIKKPTITPMEQCYDFTNFVLFERKKNQLLITKKYSVPLFAIAVLISKKAKYILKAQTDK